MENKDIMEWFTKADFSKYGYGNYVGIVEKKVISSGISPAKVFNEAKKQYPNKEVILWKIPRKEMMVL